MLLCYIAISLSNAKRCRPRIINFNQAHPFQRQQIEIQKQNQEHFQQVTSQSRLQRSTSVPLDQGISQVVAAFNNGPLAQSMVNPIMQAQQALSQLVAKVPVYRSSDLVQDALHQHNAYRQLIGMPPVRINVRLVQYAQNYANKLANGYAKMGVHSNGPYGENMSWSGDPRWTVTVGAAIKQWFEEFKYYNGEPIPNPPTALFEQYGHFTQIAWPATTDIGCAVAHGKFGTHIVCEYLPKGNMHGSSVKYGINFQVNGKATVRQ
jgi:hypothetical protein